MPTALTDAPAATSSIPLQPPHTAAEPDTPTLAHSHLQQLLQGEWKLDKYNDVLWSIRNWATRLVGFKVEDVSKTYTHHPTCPSYALNKKRLLHQTQPTSESQTNVHQSSYLHRNKVSV